ncbi:MAG TPA: acyl-CoA dehydrogenase family protein [Acidimicrobiales bacterium]|nr:acyl-CoA dehydrogenase family protein [Acidimicrobiales bacterium]
MDFTFSSEQEQLRQAVRATLAAEAPREYVRRMIDDPVGVSGELWAKMAELGWTATLVPADAGGLGLGLVDMVVIQEEMGRLPLPGPFLSSAVLATLAATRLSAADLLAALASGSARGTIALEEPGHGDPVARVRTTATRAGDGFVLDGVKPLVLDGHSADWAIVAALTDEGLGSFLVERPEAEPVPCLDVTRKMSRLVLSSRPARRLGPPGDQSGIWRRVADDGAVALCAELVGCCEQALHQAVEYAKSRVQFDRPIASFQVIRHKTVDMLHQLELARVGTHYAAWASDNDDPAREHAVAMCKGFVGEAANFITAEDIQIHGGMGFTWDVDAHLFFRRAKQDDLLLGAAPFQRQRLADLVLGPAAS